MSIILYLLIYDNKKLSKLRTLNLITFIEIKINYT